MRAGPPSRSSWSGRSDHVRTAATVRRSQPSRPPRRLRGTDRSGRSTVWPPPAWGAGKVLAADPKRKYGNPKGMARSADHDKDAVWTHRPHDRAGIGFDADLFFQGLEQAFTPGHDGSRERGGIRSLQIEINFNETAPPGVTEIETNSHVSLRQGGLSDLLRTVLRRLFSRTRLWCSRLNSKNCAGVTVRRRQSVILRAIEEAAVGRERGNAKLSGREMQFANRVKLLCKHGSVRTEFRVL